MMDTMAPIDTTESSERLSDSMRTGSRDEHEAAESSSFVSALVGGALPAAAYGDYLLRYVRVYEALEEATRTLADTAVGRAVYDPALERTERIGADLDHWVGPEWRSAPLDSPASAAYVDAVRAVVVDPPLLVAHHYTRYLGDLAGGQVIGRAMTRQHGLAPGVGVAFYDFPDLGKVKPYRDAYRARVDALGLGADEHERVVAEVRRAFALNAAIFAELGALYVTVG